MVRMFRRLCSGSCFVVAFIVAGVTSLNAQTQRLARSSSIRVDNSSVGPSRDSHLPPLAPGYSCSIFLLNNDLWLRTLKDGQPQFEFRFGGGGAIEDIHDPMTNSSLLMEAAYPGNVTDRVVQQTFWSAQTINPTAEKNFNFLNINQAGDSVNRITPARRALYNKSDCTIDILSIPQLDWNPPNNSRWLGFLPTATRYSVFGNGAVQVRNVTNLYALYSMGALANGVPTRGYQPTFSDFIVSTWIPLAPMFTQVANSFSNGRGAAVLDPNSIRSIGKVRSVANSTGLTVAYDANNYAAPALGIVYGTKTPVCVSEFGSQDCPSPSINYRPTGVDSHESTGHRNMILTLNLSLRDKVPMGTTFVHEYYLVPMRSLSRSNIASVEALVSTVPAPLIYAPKTALRIDLQKYQLFFDEPRASYPSNHLGPIAGPINWATLGQ